MAKRGWFESVGAGVGAYGESQTGPGVQGTSTGTGVSGTSTGTGVGVYGFAGIKGNAQVGPGSGSAGVWGENMTSDGVHGWSHGSGSGVAGISAEGVGVYGRGGVYAGQFQGNVQVKGGDVQVEGSLTANTGVFDGDVQVNGSLTANTGVVQVSGTIKVASGGDIILADFSEEFDITVTAEAEPGTVMVLDQHGALEPSQQAYDKKVAGVISGLATTDLAEFPGQKGVIRGEDARRFSRQSLL